MNTWPRLATISNEIRVTPRPENAWKLLIHRPQRSWWCGKGDAELYIRGNYPSAYLSLTHWINKKHAYEALGRIATGKCRNIGNALRTARKGGISNTHLSVSDCQEGIAVCKQWLKGLESSSRGLWKVHLRNCLVSAKALKDNTKYNKILQIIHKEETRST